VFLVLYTLLCDSITSFAGRAIAACIHFRVSRVICAADSAVSGADPREVDAYLQRALQDPAVDAATKREILSTCCWLHEVHIRFCCCASQLTVVA
jgi:hypothetical protein